MAKAVDKVRRSFTKSGKDSQFITQWLSGKTAAEAIRTVDEYNYFRGEETAGAVMRIAEKDPNARFKFGREGSPVLYIETRKPRVAIGVISQLLDKWREPDELQKVPGSRATNVRNGHSLVRAWWD